MPGGAATVPRQGVHGIRPAIPARPSHAAGPAAYRCMLCWRCSLGTTFRAASCDAIQGLAGALALLNRTAIWQIAADSLPGMPLLNAVCVF